MNEPELDSESEKEPGDVVPITPETIRIPEADGFAVQLHAGVYHFGFPTLRVRPKFLPNGQAELDSYWGYPQRTQRAIDALTTAFLADRNAVPLILIFTAAAELLCLCHALTPADAFNLLDLSEDELPRLVHAIVTAVGHDTSAEQETPP
jgi:hypothetical protein